MSIAEIYAGVQQADVAAMTVGGISYRCFVWAAAPNDDGPQRVEAAIFADGEGGQLVLVDFSVVAEAVADLVDCPRVLAVEASNLFVVHWADYSANADASLHRSLFNMTDIAAGWDSQGSVTLHETCQYDHATIIDDADDEFIVVRRTAAGTIVSTRYTSPFSWLNVDWSHSRAGLTIDDTILGCHADGAVLLYSYQSALALVTAAYNATAGTFTAETATFADITIGGEQGYNWTAVTHRRYTSTTFLVAAEGNTTDNIAAADGVLPYLRFVAFRAITGTTTTALYNSQLLWNVHLESRLWVWPSGVTGELECYSGWGFKSIADGDEFSQMFGGVMRYTVHELPTAALLAVRPVPASIQANGTWDSRPHGISPATLVTIGKRLNHLSHVTPPPQYSLGPDGKTVLFAHTRWGRLAAISDSPGSELQPVEAGIAYHRFDHEPPWTVRRSTLEVTQPDTPAWRGVSRGHALPVETPAGLVWTGGVMSTYDGRQVVELGFMWGAEILSAEPVGAGGGMDVAEEYHWTVVPTWKDSRGNVHRGPPSRPVSASIVVGGYCTLRIRCINLSMKDDRVRYPSAQRIYFEVYRTSASGAGAFETSGGLYLFRSEFGGSTAGWQIHDLPSSDPSEPLIEVDAGRPNSVVNSNELAPWQLDLDTLLWTPPPPIPHQPLDIAAVWQNRLFGVDHEGLLRWSEEILPRGADLRKPELLDTNVMRLAGIGRVTALIPFEGEMAVLSSEGLHSIAGDPGAGGSGNTFQLRTIARGDGNIEPRSVAVWRDGYTYQSAKRIMVGTRGAGVEDIGGPIEDTIREGGNVRSAVYLDDRDELSFTFAGLPGTGPLVVRPREARFNLRSKQWTIRRLPLAASSSSASRLNEPMHACAWRALQGGLQRVILLQGAILRERSATDIVYSDEAVGGSQSIRLDVTSEWITMGLDETKRYPEIGIVTERVNAGPLTIEQWSDHDGSFDNDTGTPDYTLTIASPAPAFIRFRPVPSKCRAIKLRIYEPDSAPSTENVRFVALVVHWMIFPRRQGSRNNASST